MALKQELFAEMNLHLLGDKKPSEFITGLSQTPLFKQYPLNLLEKLIHTKQSPKHHPEGSAWNHTLLVLDEAAEVKKESKDERVFMWAALLHDVGKPDTTKIRNGRITSYDHDKVGASLAEKFLEEFTDDNDFIGKVCSLIRWHMQILFVVNGLPFADLKNMKKEADIREIAMLGLCDRLGRLGADRKQEENNIKIFIEKCESDVSQ